MVHPCIRFPKGLALQKRNPYLKKKKKLLAPVQGVEEEALQLLIHEKKIMEMEKELPNQA